MLTKTANELSERALYETQRRLPNRNYAKDHSFEEWSQYCASTDEAPRRERMNILLPAERAIGEAMLTVERMPAHTLLTDAVILLQQARAKVTNYIDRVYDRESEEALTQHCGQRIRLKGKTPA